MNNLRHLNTLFAELNSKRHIKSISNNTYLFHDEPKLNNYSIILEKSPAYYRKNNYQVNAQGMGANGVSLSKEMALLKCLSEAVERFSACCYKKESIFYSSYNSLIDNHLKALDPTIYLKNPKIIEEKIGWIEGYDQTLKSRNYIPAQLVYLNYRRPDETRLTNTITTGAAGGFDHKMALLTGIYEVVERDAFMTVYLNKISPQNIDIQKIPDATILSLVDILQKYHLQPYLINLTNDLNIPVFLTILIDKTGIGPAVSLGLKSSLNIKEAIIHSIEEAFQIRPWIRREIMKKKSLSIRNKPEQINNHLDRALFWYPLSMIAKLKFLFSRQKTAIKTRSFSGNKKQELAKVKELIEKKKFRIYYVDITLPNFRKINYLVYKTIIPGLQPLYLDESHKEVIMERLKSVASYFGYNRTIINSMPHPFL